MHAVAQRPWRETSQLFTCSLGASGFARLSFMRFAGLALEDRVPDAKTIWLHREQLTQAGAIERLFERFDAALRDAGYLAMSGQIVDATVGRGAPAQAE